MIRGNLVLHILDTIELAPLTSVRKMTSDSKDI